MGLLRGLFVQRDENNNGTTPKGARLALAGLMGRTSGNAVRTGVLVDGMGPIVSGTGSMAYDVRAFAAISRYSTANGPTLFANDATVQVTTTAAPGSNSRIDLIYAMQRLITADGGAGSSNEAEIGVIQGTVASSPSAPAVPAGAVALGTVHVTANATSTAGLVVSSPANMWTVANGGIIPTSSTTGQVWNGSSWTTVHFGQFGPEMPTPGPAANLTPAWSPGGAQVIRVGATITLTVEMQVTTGGSSGWLLCTLPPDYCPTTRKHIALFGGGGNPYASGYVLPNGEVRANASVTAAAQIVGTATWVIGA